MVNKLYKILQIIIFLTLLSDKSYANFSTQKIKINELLIGDIIFWKGIDKKYIASHVAVLTKSGFKSEDIKISHSTTLDEYKSFAETYMHSSKELSLKGYQYFVIRIKNQKIRENFLKIVKELIELRVPFNDQSRKLMHCWENSMAEYPPEIKLSAQNNLFSYKKKLDFTISKEGLMCSEAIILCLQKAFINNGFKKNLIPLSLKLDHKICPPSIMMFALIKDYKNFKVIGNLEI